MLAKILLAIASAIAGGVLVFGAVTFWPSAQENDTKAAKAAVLGYFTAIKKSGADEVCSSFSKDTLVTKWRGKESCITKFTKFFAESSPFKEATFEVTTVAFFAGPVGTIAEVKILYSPRGNPSFQPIYLTKENGEFKIVLRS